MLNQLKARALHKATMAIVSAAAVFFTAFSAPSAIAAAGVTWKTFKTITRPRMTC